MNDKQREWSDAVAINGNKRKRREEPQQRTVAIHDDLFSGDDEGSV
jgi:hypothetical protein